MCFPVAIRGEEFRRLRGVAALSADDVAWPDSERFCIDMGQTYFCGKAGRILQPA
jgi:hypothetical protein